ncbi:MAG: hypothetical protein LBE22_07760 [Azoarcus sp.]|jgi:uncharacterized protein YycO|nr:hypothetical protein [Azoarcus sp.]
MADITFYFCHGQKLHHKLIRFFTRSYWNHVAVTWVSNGNPDDSIYEADFNGVIATEALAWFKNRHGERIESLTIYVSDTVATKFREAILAKLYSPYDFVALVGYLFNTRKLNTEKKYFCSELLAECLKEAGLDIIPSNKEWRVTPGEFYLAMRGFNFGCGVG